MKIVLSVLFLLVLQLAVPAQNEQAPIVAKDVDYPDWQLKDVRTGDMTTLAKLAAGKRYVIIVYFAAWCPNWRFDAPLIEKLYSDYRSQGLAVIGVAEYDSVAETRSNLKDLKVTFPVVYESEALSERLKTRHYELRKAAGDTRKWGSPWYVMLEPAPPGSGALFTRNAMVVNGEIVPGEVEKNIIEHLGLLPKKSTFQVTKSGEIEPCPAEPPTPKIISPGKP